LLVIFEYCVMMHGNTNIKEHRLSVFENRVLRKISGPQKDDVTG